MPAPKQFKPGPRTLQDQPQTGPVVATKGRYAVVHPTAPIVDDPATVEVAIDDITLVLDGSSKYENRSFHAYGEIEDPAVEDVPVEAQPPTFVAHTPLGEWRSSSSLEGTRYRRTDSRLI